MNWKAGGTLERGKVLYHVEPQGERQPEPKEVLGHCRTRYDFLYDSYWIEGAGWGDSDSGDRLRDELYDCAGSHYGFGYQLKDDGSEWQLSGRSPVWRKKCIEGAIKDAGGPSDISCSGNG